MLKIKNIYKQFKGHDGRLVKVLNNINFSVKKGEFVTIFGPNGCGKSTLMSIIAGIEKSTSGTIEFGNSSIKIGYVFQDYNQSILPWKNVWQNIAAPLLWSGEDKKIAYEKVVSMFEKFNLNLDLNAYPSTLSGGQAQMVCILRSLIIDPDILILDEPFSALDHINQFNLMMKFQEIQHTIKTTTLFISHNIDEAIFLGDKLMLLSHCPTSILKNISIPIQKPRNRNIFTHNEFIKIKEKALSVTYGDSM